MPIEPARDPGQDAPTAPPVELPPIGPGPDIPQVEEPVSPPAPQEAPGVTPNEIPATPQEMR